MLSAGLTIAALLGFLLVMFGSENRALQSDKTGGWIYMAYSACSIIVLIASAAWVAIGEEFDASKLSYRAAGFTMILAGAGLLASTRGKDFWDFSRSVGILLVFICGGATLILSSNLAA